MPSLGSYRSAWQLSFLTLDPASLRAGSVTFFEPRSPETVAALCAAGDGEASRPGMRGSAALAIARRRRSILAFSARSLPSPIIVSSIANGVPTREQAAGSVQERDLGRAIAAPMPVRGLRAGGGPHRHRQGLRAAVSTEPRPRQAWHRGRRARPFRRS
jgi:hypothetical protein